MTGRLSGRAFERAAPRRNRVDGGRAARGSAADSGSCGVTRPGEGLSAREGEAWEGRDMAGRVSGRAFE